MTEVEAVRLPAGLLGAMAGRPSDDQSRTWLDGQPWPTGEQWLAQVPTLVRDALDRWSLRLQPGEPLRYGFCSVVVPVRRPRGDAGVLKVGWPHGEARDEHRSLRAWRGRGAVALLAADPATWTLLLEPLDPTRDLMAGPAVDASERIGVVLRLLDRPAPPWADRLSESLPGLRGRVVDESARAAGRLPRRFLQQARSLIDALVSDEEVDARLVHTDLHQMNVLWRPDPGEWVAIDPKPMAADPAYALAPSLWNRWDDVMAAHDPRVHLGLRLETTCAAAGIDPDRARAWTIVRMVDYALWSAGTGWPDADEALTTAVTIIKAMQPR